MCVVTWFLRLCAVLAIFGAVAAPTLTAAQEAPAVHAAPSQTLSDILRRQQALAVDDSVRRAADGSAAAAPMVGDLGTRGGASDSDLWRAIRFGTANGAVSIPDKKAAGFIQDSGMQWGAFRAGPLMWYGGWGLALTLVLLLIFYILRGRIRVESGLSGETVERFKTIERFGHWLMAVSFIILGLSGLAMLYGREWLIPVMGKEGYASLAAIGKWLHNYLAFSFMAGLALTFVLWVAHNLPSRTDIGWILKGGGLFSAGSHPPAKKFNAGQKVVFWGVMVLGASVSASGVMLLLPFEFALFGKTFGHLNALFGLELPTALSAIQEQQLAQLWHAIIAFVMMMMILAHIYIGTIGMQGAFDAMGSGQVDRNWAHEHHSLWLDEVDARASKGAAE